MNKKILFIIIIVLLFVSLQVINNYIQPNLPRLKLAVKMLNKTFAEVQADFSSQDCKKFSDEEKANGFEGLVTAYCKPKAAEFKSRQEFLCAVGLNCSCPNGRNQTKDCESSTLKWSSCLDFNENKSAYCDQTADQSEPTAGHVAADWSCFPQNTRININEQIYTVVDKGSAIKGRRFDVWYDDCRDIEKKTGIYNIKINR